MSAKKERRREERGVLGRAVLERRVTLDRSLPLTYRVIGET
jgi:hypothetical protein